MEHKMRRADRLVTDPTKISKCLSDSKALHIGIWDGEEVYVIPVNFGFTCEDDNYTLYFHGAKKGRKAELAATNPTVGFQCETNLETVSALEACDWTEKFLSIIGNGTLSIVEDIEEKKSGLNIIMAKASSKADWQFPEAMLNATAVYKIEVTKISCKENA